MTKNEAMQLALTILLEYYEKENGLWGRAEDAIDALLAALAQPEKEWVGLTDDEIKHIDEMTLDKEDAIRLTAVALQEKNS